MKGKTIEFKWLLTKSKPIHLFIVIICLLNVVNSIVGVKFALVTKEMIDIASGSIKNGVFEKGVGLVLIVFLQLSLNTLNGYLSAKIINKFEMNLKENYFSRILKKQWYFITKYHSGELVSRLNSDISIVTNNIGGMVPGTVSLFSTLLASLYVLWKFDYVFALVILVTGPIFMVFGHLYGKYMKKIHLRCQESAAAIRSFMQETIQNLIVVKAFQNEYIDKEKLTLLQKANYSILMKRSMCGLVSNGGMYLAVLAGYCFAIIWGSYRLSTGFITFGTLTVFLQLSSQVQAPIMSLGRIVSNIYMVAASVSRLMEIENIAEESNEKAEEITDFQEIMFDHVSYGYDDKIVLDDICLKIKKGDYTAVTGDSGEGKTTLIRLLLGLITPNKGNIKIIGKYREVKLSSSTRGLFAYVPQGNIVFSGTIRDNIKYARPTATDEEVIKAAKCACAWDFISNLPLKLDTVIGERGVGLSEGQIQRLSIARAIMVKAPILLFDEATSALDKQTESQILSNLRKLDHIWACIIISHNQSSAAFCDQTIAISSGKAIS